MAYDENTPQTTSPDPRLLIDFLLSQSNASPSPPSQVPLSTLPATQYPEIEAPTANYPQPNDPVVGPVNPNPSGQGSGVLNSALGITGQASGILQNLAPFINLFKPNVKNQRAAALQQAIEKSAMDINQAVVSGQIDTSAAIQQLQHLQQQTTSVGSANSPELTSAGIRANLIVNQVIANLQTRHNSQLSEPFTPGAAPLAGGPQDQKQRVGTGIRNYIAGTDLGNQFNQSSPVLKQALGHTPAPTDRLNDTSAIVKNQFPLDLPSLKRPLKEQLY